MGSIIELEPEEKQNTHQTISEDVAHELIANKESVFMVFERPNGTLYGYTAIGVTDLNHAKKVQMNTFLRFEKLQS